MNRNRLSGFSDIITPPAFFTFHYRETKGMSTVIQSGLVDISHIAFKDLSQFAVYLFTTGIQISE